MTNLDFNDVACLALEGNPGFAWPDEPEMPWCGDVPLLERHRAYVQLGIVTPQYAPCTCCQVRGLFGSVCRMPLFA